MCETVPTSRNDLTPQEISLQDKPSGTALTIKMFPIYSGVIRQDSNCGTVSINVYSALQDQKEALSQIEDFMKHEGIQEGSKIRTVPDSFYIKEN